MFLDKSIFFFLFLINNNMKLFDIDPELLDEAKASRKLCLSKIPNERLGASQLSSCKAQGLRRREDPKQRRRMGGTMKKTVGRKIKSSKYGGPIKDYWSGKRRKS